WPRPRMKYLDGHLGVADPSRLRRTRMRRRSRRWLLRRLRTEIALGGSLRAFITPPLNGIAGGSLDWERRIQAAHGRRPRRRCNRNVDLWLTEIGGWRDRGVGAAQGNRSGCPRI